LELKKIAIQQPSLPKYRIPVFSQLNSDHALDVTLFYGSQADLPNMKATGFKAERTNSLRLKLPGLGELFLDWTQLKICGDRSWDAIVLTWNTRYLTLIPSLLRAKFNGIPVILWGHGYSKKRGFLRDFIRRTVSRLAKAVLFYDPVSMKAFSNPGNNHTCFVAPNAIDQRPILEQRDAWTSEPDKLGHFRLQHDLKEREIVLFVSRYDPNNRLDILIQAMSEVKKLRPQSLLTIIGSGNDREKEELKNLVNSLNLSENVRFLGSIYRENEIAPWFLSAKIFCYPSNVGLSLLHAFGYGIPVLLGDDFSRCNPEIYAFENDFNGCTFVEGSSTDLSKQIVNLLADDSLRQQLSTNGIQTVANKASLDNMVQGFAVAIKAVAKTTPARAINKNSHPRNR
jgi:glycosyltransferase involved in cell wall biosynthesis